MDNPMTGSELRAFREARKLNQQNLAELINSQTGKSYDKANVSRWENGKADVPQEVATCLRTSAAAQPLGIPAQIGPAVITAVSNQKGGVGKTTMAVNLAYALANAGKKVALIDCDPQGSATIHLGLNPRLLEKQGKTLSHVLGRDVPTQTALTPVMNGLFDVLASSITLAEVEVGLLADTSGTGSLTMREKLGEIADGYDHIILDCPPNLSLLSASTLNASDRVLIPSQAALLSVMAIPMLVMTVAKVRRRVNPKLKILGIVPTQVRRRSQDMAMLAELEQAAEEHGLRLFPSIRDNKVYTDSVTKGVPALSLKNATATEVFDAIVVSLREVEAEKKEAAHVVAQA